MLFVEIRKLWTGTDVGKCIRENHIFFSGHGKFERYISYSKGSVKESARY